MFSAVLPFQTQVLFYYCSDPYRLPQSGPKSAAAGISKCLCPAMTAAFVLIQLKLLPSLGSRIPSWPFPPPWANPTPSPAAQMGRPQILRNAFLAEDMWLLQGLPFIPRPGIWPPQRAYTSFGPKRGEHFPCIIWNSEAFPGARHLKQKRTFRASPNHSHPLQPESCFFVEDYHHSWNLNRHSS